ncbi:MAG: TRAP transporter small permease [Candidatus Accumulibacter sp.]|jgi:TRAP-type C4-dicarboxylate transport system permease small subunit|nr:TRAP transporter small permease [Accumulibacter sp.]
MEAVLYKFLKIVCFLLMLAMVAIIFLQVVARYAFSNSLSWSEEIGRYLFVWMTFIGSAIAVRNRLHVSLDMFVIKFPGCIQKSCLVISYVSMMIFTGVLIYGGYRFVMRGSQQVSAAMQLPMHYVYVVLPVGGGLIFFYLMKNIYEDVFVRR